MTTHTTHPYRCDVCSRTMRKASDHAVLAGGLIACRWCMVRPIHDEVYPGCSHPGHDLNDHLLGVVAERGEVPALLAVIGATTDPMRSGVTPCGAHIPAQRVTS